MNLPGPVRVCLGLLAAAWISASPADAASITRKTNGDLVLEGRIEVGDLGKLRALIGESKRASPAASRKLFLNSNGGELAEADRIIAAMWRGEGELPDTIGPLETVVPAGAKCLSSCAFIFMHGLGPQEETEYPVARSIHVSATLGFHRPSFVIDPSVDIKDVPVEDLAKIRSESDAAFTRIISFGAMTTDLIAAFEPKGANEYLAIENARQAAEWSIGVFVDDPGRAPTFELTAQNAFTACTRFQEPDYRPNAVTYDAYTKGGRLGDVRKPPSYKDSERHVWTDAYLVKVPGGDGNDLSCAVWLPNPENVTRVSTETEGEPADLSWLYLLPPGLALPEIPGFLLRDQVAALEKKRPGKEFSNIDPADPQEPDKPATDPLGLAAPVVERPLDQPYAAQVCNASQGFGNARKGPGPRFDLVDRLPNRTSVTVTAEAENPESKAPWKAIRFTVAGRGLVTAYIDATVLSEHCSLVVNVDPPPVTPPEANPEEAMAPQSAVVCNAAASFANIRKGPAPSYDVAGKVDNGGTITLLAKRNNPQSGQPWYRVAFGGGRSGYIDSDYVAENCEPANQVENPDEPAPGGGQIGVVCNGASVYSNVRSGPSSTFDALGRVNNHDRVAVLSQKQNPSSGHPWFEIQFENHGKLLTGYIDSDAVRATCDLAGNLAMDRQVCNAASPISNVRAGPASNRQLMDQLRNGTKVFVVKGHSSPLSGHLWFEIRYGENAEKQGYIDADAVKADCQVAQQ